jgi:rhodanese-related sulfurtransferase
MFSEFITLNLWWFVALVTVLNLLLFSFIQGSVRGAMPVSALQMPALQRAGKSVIYDLNKPDQYAKAHIAGSINIALDDLNSTNKAVLKQKDHTVVLVCQTGSESIKAAKRLVALGFTKVHPLKGGLVSWQKDNLPLVAT